MSSQATCRRLLLIAWVVGLTMTLAEVAWANNGPHGNYSPTTDACAGCHRAHTATQDKLLIGGDIASLCLTCHGSAGTGADTNVADGVYTDRQGGGEGTVNAPLLGGGFVNYQGAPVTSAHTVDGSTQTAWGSSFSGQEGCGRCHKESIPGRPQFSDNIGGPGVDMSLTCTSCHIPHGSVNYRLLEWTNRAYHFPDNVRSNETGGDDPAQGPPGYAPDYTTPNYKQGLGAWCVLCHTNYNLTQGAYRNYFTQPDPTLGYDAGDGFGFVVRYRHAIDIPIVGVTDPESGITYDLTTSLPLESDKLFCLTCHRAHGTSTTMAGFAQDVAPAGDSTLLRLDNRGVCEDCHKK